MSPKCLRATGRAALARLTVLTGSSEGSGRNSPSSPKIKSGGSSGYRALNMMSPANETHGQTGSMRGNFQTGFRAASVRLPLSARQASNEWRRRLQASGCHIKQFAAAPLVCRFSIGSETLPTEKTITPAIIYLKKSCF